MPRTEAVGPAVTVNRHRLLPRTAAVGRPTALPSHRLLPRTAAVGRPTVLPCHRLLPWTEAVGPAVTFERHRLLRRTAPSISCSPFTVYCTDERSVGLTTVLPTAPSTARWRPVGAPRPLGLHRLLHRRRGTDSPLPSAPVGAPTTLPSHRLRRHSIDRRQPSDCTVYRLVGIISVSPSSATAGARLSCRLHRPLPRRPTEFSPTAPSTAQTGPPSAATIGVRPMPRCPERSAHTVRDASHLCPSKAWAD